MRPGYSKQTSPAADSAPVFYAVRMGLIASLPMISKIEHSNACKILCSGPLINHHLKIMATTTLTTALEAYCATLLETNRPRQFSIRGTCKVAPNEKGKLLFINNGMRTRCPRSSFDELTPLFGSFPIPGGWKLLYQGSQVGVGEDNLAFDINLRLVRDSEPLLTAHNGIRAHATRVANKYKDTTLPFQILIRWTEDNIVYINESDEEFKGPKCSLKRLKQVLKSLNDDSTWLIHGKWRLEWYDVLQGNTLRVLFYVPGALEKIFEQYAVADDSDSDVSLAEIPAFPGDSGSDSD
jgi:hypothetical protein